jgi:group I intron endonuclease
LTRRAHNSTFPEKLVLSGKSYQGPTELYRSVNPEPNIPINTFMGRIRKLHLMDKLDEKFIFEALYMPVKEYMEKYSVRKSLVNVEGQEIELADYYKKHQEKANVDYPTFRSRLKNSKNIDALDSEILIHALTLTYEKWITFYGGGRHRPFVYDGDLYPQHSGKRFHGFSAFLRVIGRYDDKSTIWSRIKLGWNIDSALDIPVDILKDHLGKIYKITRLSTGQIYVGLTKSSIKQRWSFHLSNAKGNTKKKIAQAIRNDGPEGFLWEILEDNIDSNSKLKEREEYWIRKFDARGPNGLNTAAAGALGSSKGISVSFEGESFESMKEAGYVLGKRNGIPSFTVERCIRNGLELPKKTRKNSNHNEAGTNLFRRWLALKKRHLNDIDIEWRDNYDIFKKDVGQMPKEGLRLIRINSEKPWGPGNWCWGNDTEFIQSIHGKPISAHGKSYPSLKALAEAFGIGYSTLKNRIRVQKLSPEDAVDLPLGPTNGKHRKKFKIEERR